MQPFEQSANLLFNWFKNNQIKVNEDGCHVLSSIDKTMLMMIKPIEGSEGVSSKVTCV